MNASPSGDNADLPLLPVRMVNEFVYCPRLAYLEWVQGEWADNEDTIEGKIGHRRVDEGEGALPAEAPARAAEGTEPEVLHARSVRLSSETLGITSRLDLVEAEGRCATPVDYKRGKRPHVAAGAYDPERVQLCAQGLLLREHGYECTGGFIYFVGSRERVPVIFDDALIAQTLAAIDGLRSVAASTTIPPPLADSPKCPRCSLIGICLPDEVRYLLTGEPAPRQILPRLDEALPLYVQSPRARVRKDGECLLIEEGDEKVATVRLNEVSQIVLHSPATLTAPALLEAMQREIPVTWLTYGGWFVGHTQGVGHKNVEARTSQYRASFDKSACLRLARGIVAAKIANARTLLRRNWRGAETCAGEDEAEAGPAESQAPPELLIALKGDRESALAAASLSELLGIEGAAAMRYFQSLSQMLRGRGEDGLGFDFSARNRRPPRDPVNSMLSFCYAMLTREWTMVLSAVGLDPYRGFYHQPRFGRPALALDMMEPFRPLVADSTVLMAINNGELKPADFRTVAGSCLMSNGGRKRLIAGFERRLQQEVTHPIFGYRISYRRLFEVQARLLIRHLTGEIPDFPQFVTR